MPKGGKVSNPQATPNRWLVVAGAIMVQLCLGVVYAWPSFTIPLVEAGWTKTQTQVVFSVGLAVFAVVMVIAGRLISKVGPRVLTIAGGILLGLGYLLAGLSGGTSFTTILVLIGLVGGAGVGLAYVVPIAVGMRWFPDKKGLITGLAVAGYGFGATLWIKLADNWGNLLARFGMNGTFVVYGIVFTLVIMLGSIWMVFPPDGWKPAGWIPPSPKDGKRRGGGNEFTSREMLRTPQFYMILFTFAFGASAGLMAIGLMKLFPIEALSSAMKGAATAAGRAVDEKAIFLSASTISGTAMAIFFALANGLGRILWGLLSDILGRKRSIVTMMAIQGVMVILFQWMASSESLLYLGATLIGFNYGGIFALFPTITADTFGAKHVGQNYGWVFLAYGIGGILGPIMGGKLGDMRNFPLAFTICGGLCLLAAIIASFINPATKERSQ